MTATVSASRQWISGWDPEDPEFWQRTGRRVAIRNLVMSVLSEHIGFSVWTMWSVLVLFMAPANGFDFAADEKFLLVAVPTVVGALLRLPYSYAVTRFGGRTWTTFSTAILLVPAGLAAVFVNLPGTPLWVFLLIGAVAGVGGANFASSMTNITTFFPRRHQGWALGVNAGGGNLGVAVIQLVGLLVIAVAGAAHPSYVAVLYLPLIVLATLLAARRMDNVDAVRAEPGAQREALANPHTWWISFLYIGTFGSFIGFAFAFGLVLQTQFGSSPLQAATYTFLGPLLGSLFRPVGGWLADRNGGAVVTLLSFVGLAGGTLVLLIASAHESFPLFVAGFTALFVLSGIGNGSVYKMIPAVLPSRRISGAVIGIAGAVGALGGVAINLAFRDTYGGVERSGTSAFVSFLVFYAVCVLVVARVYLRRGSKERHRV